VEETSYGQSAGCLEEIYCQLIRYFFVSLWIFNQIQLGIGKFIRYGYLFDIAGLTVFL